jgi:CheY-like chemotaxis protein
LFGAACCSPFSARTVISTALPIDLPDYLQKLPRKECTVKHESLTAAAGRAIVIETCLLANGGPVTSVVICDDRPAVRQSLSEMLLPLPSLATIDSVTDGFALVDVCTGREVDIVLIGVHDANTTGEDAIGLLLGMAPATAVIIIGSANDIDLLAAVASRGARGLLLWDVPDWPGQGTQGHGPLVW